jgi:DNA transformation protein and related proteins
MPVSADFRDFVLEQLTGGARGGEAGGGAVTARAMFGGYGLYSEAKVLFAVLDDDAVFFRVDEESRPAFEAAGSRPFAPIPGQQPMRSYWELPAEVLEDREAAAAWKARAILAAEHARDRKGRKPAKTGASGRAKTAGGGRRGRG